MIKTPLIPKLIEEVFDRISTDLENQPNPKRMSDRDFIELHSIFGNTLEQALNILDTKRITVYRSTTSTNSSYREICEISSVNSNNPVTYKLFPNINYCNCLEFNMNLGDLTQKYTCKHVLALKLAIILGLLQNINMLTQSQISQLKFVGKLDNIKSIYGSLKSINFDETATFQFSEDGLRVIVENAKFIQGIVYITRGCFSQYILQSNDIIRFSIGLNVITECLSIFAGVDCSMKMLYKGDGTPLMLVLEHNGDEDWLTECSIKTKHYEEPMYYNVDEDSNTYNYVYLRGPDFANLIHEIDKSAEKLEISLSNDEPHFKITIIGVMQSESNFEIPKDSDMIIKFSCQKPSKRIYKYSHIKTIIKALSLASQVAIKTDENGLLELHFMIQSDNDALIYTQFFIPPLVDYD